MKLTITTTPPIPLKVEKRYMLELSEEEALLLLRLIGGVTTACSQSMNSATRELADNIYGELINNGVHF